MTEQATCIKEVYLSLPDRVVIDNGIVPNDEEMYLVFEIGKQYYISKEYKTLGNETMRHIASKLKYVGHPKRKYVYDLFVTKYNPKEVRDIVVKTKDFNRYFKIDNQVEFQINSN